MRRTRMLELGVERLSSWSGAPSRARACSTARARSRWCGARLDRRAELRRAPRPDGWISWRTSPRGDERASSPSRSIGARTAAGRDGEAPPSGSSLRRSPRADRPLGEERRARHAGDVRHEIQPSGPAESAARLGDRGDAPHHRERARGRRTGPRPLARQTHELNAPTRARAIRVRRIARPPGALRKITSFCQLDRGSVRDRWTSAAAVIEFAVDVPADATVILDRWRSHASGARRPLVEVDLTRAAHTA